MPGLPERELLFVYILSSSFDVSPDSVRCTYDDYLDEFRCVVDYPRRVSVKGKDGSVREESMDKVFADFGKDEAYVAATGQVSVSPVYSLAVDDAKKLYVFDVRVDYSEALRSLLRYGDDHDLAYFIERGMRGHPSVYHGLVSCAPYEHSTACHVVAGAQSKSKAREEVSAAIERAVNDAVQRVAARSLEYHPVLGDYAKGLSRLASMCGMVGDTRASSDVKRVAPDSLEASVAYNTHLVRKSGGE